MRQLFSCLTIITTLITSNLTAQNKNYENDVKTIDALMKVSYEVVSGEKGAKREWERDHYLHHPKAVYSYFDGKEKKQATMTLQEFHGHFEANQTKIKFQKHLTRTKKRPLTSVW